MTSSTRAKFYSALLIVPLTTAGETEAADTSAPHAPYMFCVGTSCVTTSVSVTTSRTETAIKFDPGHYMATNAFAYLSDKDTKLSTIVSQINSDICPYPEVKGLQIHALWSVLEGAAAGDYSGGFAFVDTIRDALAACNKKLMILAHDRLYGGYGDGLSNVMPAYLLTSTYGAVESPGTCVSGVTSGYRKGGVYAANGSACAYSGSMTVMPALWEAPVMDRLIALSQAYGARYNSDSTVTMFAPMGELAGGASTGSSSYSEAAFSTQIKRLYTATRAAWPNTALRHAMNYGGPISTQCSLLNSLVALDVAIGGPDVLPGEEITANRVFSNRLSECQDYRGVVPWVSEVQVPELGGKEGTYTASQLYTYAMQGGAASGSGATGTGVNSRPMWPQYWVWVRNEWSGGTDQRWSTGLRPYITDTIDGAVSNGTDQTQRTPASVKSTYCPSGYSGGCQ